MNHCIKKWTLRLTVSGLFIAGLLLVIVVNPIITCASKTTHTNYTIFHNKSLDPALKSRLDAAICLVSASEFYNPDLNFDICINDGATYPHVIKALREQAFAWGFYNKVVLQGAANYTSNYVELNGYRWNLTQLLAHEMIHCAQFHHLGLWKSNPVAAIPHWKWEGYAEYVARQYTDQKDLFANIARFQSTDENAWEIYFADSTIASRAYYDHWTLVQYCMDIKKMTYHEVLADTISEHHIRQEMMRWFNGQQSN